MAEQDYAAMVERAMETLRMLGRMPLAHQELQGQQMDRLRQHARDFDYLRSDRRPSAQQFLLEQLMQPDNPTIREPVGTFQPPTNIYSGQRGLWVREPD